MRICMLLILFLLNYSCYCQRGNKLIQTVLRKNQVLKTFTFDSSNSKRADGYYKIYLTYLGKIKINNVVHKIVNAKTEFGTNRRTSGTVFIYDSNNNYYGRYSLGDGLDLPSKVEKNQLIFTNKYKKECDSKLVTKIDFSKEIPKEIFIKCRDVHGDVYSFSTDKNY